MVSVKNLTARRKCEQMYREHQALEKEIRGKHQCKAIKEGRKNNSDCNKKKGDVKKNKKERHN